MTPFEGLWIAHHAKHIMEGNMKFHMVENLPEPGADPILRASFCVTELEEAAGKASSQIIKLRAASNERSIALMESAIVQLSVALAECILMADAIDRTLKRHRREG